MPPTTTTQPTVKEKLHKRKQDLTAYHEAKPGGYSDEAAGRGDHPIPPKDSSTRAPLLILWA